MTETQQDSRLGEPAVIRPPAKKVGLKRIIAALRYSAAGFVTALRTEEAFRQETIAVCIMAPIGMWLGDTNVERVLLLGSLVLVLVVELLNTAIESVVDRVGSEYHELSKSAKDTGSAAVFLSIAMASLTWILLLPG